MYLGLETRLRRLEPQPLIPALFSLIPIIFIVVFIAVIDVVVVVAERWACGSGCSCRRVVEKGDKCHQNEKKKMKEIEKKLV